LAQSDSDPSTALAKNMIAYLFVEIGKIRTEKAAPILGLTPDELGFSISQIKNQMETNSDLKNDIEVFQQDLSAQIKANFRTGTSFATRQINNGPDDHNRSR
jgi:hypothetical protein